MSSAEKRAIASVLEGAVDLDDVVQRSVRLLAQLTRQVAVVQYPILSRSTVRHVELVALTPSRLLVVLILSTGRVEQRLVEIGGELGEHDLVELRSLVNRAAVGEVIADAVNALRALVAEQHPDPAVGGAGGSGSSGSPDSPGQVRAAATAAVVDVLVDAMSDHRSDQRVAVGGAANLARFGDNFDSAIRPLLEALEEHVVLLKLLGEASSGGLLNVTIGAEVPYEQLSATSVITTGYGPHDEAVATLGIVGPTRMDYPGTMAAVRAVARYVSRILDEA
jgi:heat-inducible transcriptional repressor